jgi:siroheme decarboxylase
MSPIDDALVRSLQGGLPLVPRPYARIAEMLGVDEDRVIEQLHQMLEDGRIRRIGAVPNHYALGYRANAMTVWDVSDEAVGAAGREIGALPFVTHCYRRPRRLPDWPYNLFAMVHGHSRDETEGKIEVIRRALGARARAGDALYSVRILKKTGLRLA